MKGELKIMTIGTTIKNLRIKKNMTQKQLGKLIGIEDSTIRKYESGRLNAKPDTLEKIAKALEIDSETLLFSELNYNRAMHHLFRIFDAYKGEFHTVTTTTTDENGNQVEKESIAISFDMLGEYIKEWKSVYEKSASSDDESEKADYFDYVYCFPESSNTTQEYKDMLIEYDKNLDCINSK